MITQTLCEEKTIIQPKTATILNVTFIANHRDFPGGPVVKTPPCNTEDSGSIPDLVTKIPHVSKKLGLQATARESVSPRYITKDP